jgi:hypothetical protein
MTTLEIIITIASATVTVSAAVSILCKIFKSSVNKVSKEMLDSNTSKIKDMLDRKIEDVTIRLDKFIETSKDVDEKQHKALMSLARDRINQAYEYHMGRKFISAHSLFTLEQLYASYTNYGGNNYTSTQISRLRELPLEAPHERENDYETNRDR